MTQDRGPRRRIAATPDSAYGERCGETEHKPNANRLHALSHDEPDDAAHRRAERATDADLGRTLSDEIPENTVKADRREHERDHTEEADQSRAETIRQHVATEAFGQRLHGHERQVVPQ